MSRPVRLALFAALAIVLAGCSRLAMYPREITDYGETANYPLEAAGLEREYIREFSPDGNHVEIGYGLYQFDSAPYVQISATIHIKRAGGAAMDSVKGRFDAARRRIEQSRLGVEQLENRSLVLAKNGRSYFALKAAYRTEGYSYLIVGAIIGPQHPWYVELIVWRHEDRIISLESYARLDNRDIAQAKNLELLDAVNWTVLPF